MKCPNCGSLNTICKDSRQHEEIRRRKYVCYNCGYIFRTIERAVVQTKQTREAADG